MKNVIVGMLLFTAGFMGVCFAQEGAPVPGMDSILGVIAPLIISLGIKFPFVSVMLQIIVYSRLVVKPLMSLLVGLATQMPNNGFRTFMLKMSDHVAYKVVAYILDWFVSIKLPKK